MLGSTTNQRAAVHAMIVPRDPVRVLLSAGQLSDLPITRPPCRLNAPLPSGPGPLVKLTYTQTGWNAQTLAKHACTRSSFSRLLPVASWRPCWLVARSSGLGVGRRGHGRKVRRQSDIEGGRVPAEIAQAPLNGPFWPPWAAGLLLIQLLKFHGAPISASRKSVHDSVECAHRRLRDCP